MTSYEKVIKAISDIKVLEKEHKIRDLYIDKDILLEDHENTIWYNGTIIGFKFEYKNKLYYASFVACGEIYVELYANNKLIDSFSCKDEITSGKSFLESHGLYNDYDFFNVTEGEPIDNCIKPTLVWFSGNWFELRIELITENKLENNFYVEELLTEGDDTADYDDIVNLNLKYLHDYIDEVEN